MTVDLLLTFGGYILFILVGFLAAWFKGNQKLSAKAASLITAAEQEYASGIKNGGEKFTWVVDQLYALIPVPLRIFLSRKLVETLVQSTFNAVEDYANLQLKKLTEKARNLYG